MPDLPLAASRDLELRYDGPIPAQHMFSEQTQRRRARGTIAVLENQASQFIDAAIRCEAEIDDLTHDLTERHLARWQRDTAERRLGATRTCLTAHIACAAQALSEARALRRQLALSPHPLVAVMTVMGADAPSPAA